MLSEMPSRWLTLALFAALAGCWADHGRGGPSPGEDAGIAVTCTITDAVVERLDCPETVRFGETVMVELTSRAAQCCASGSTRWGTFSEDRTHTIDISWDACGCCAECNCLSPSETETVRVDSIMEPGLHRVVAGGQSCEIVVIDDGPIIQPCANWGGDFRAAERLLEGQPMSVTSTIDESGGCGCDALVVGAARLDYETQVCGCCPTCDCIDPGYQAGDVGAPLPVGSHEVTFPDGPRTVTVHERAGCAPMRVNDLVVEPWRVDLIQGGARLTWARLDGEVETCCAEAEPVVEATRAADGAIELTMLSCHQDPCPCVPVNPTPGSAWLSLGELPSGEVVVRAGAREVVATIP